MDQNTLNFPNKNEVFRPVTNEKEVAVGMDFHSALHFIEGREEDERFADARHAIQKKLSEANDAEEQGTCNYYLLRLMLREHLLFENKDTRDIYKKMRENFLAAEREYRKKFFKMKRGEEKENLRSQIETFYKLVDSYFIVLEKIYEKKGFVDALERTYEDKMHFRKSFAYFSGRHLAHFGHLFLDTTSRYGHSLGRWGFTVLFFIVFFGAVYALLDYFSASSMFAHYPNKTGFFDYVYFSITTFTTLGYGDIVPVTIFEKIIVGFEVLLGFTMLGVLINLIKRHFG
ncbi:MAG: potassium channel family protein [Patescibacteria group bacterium]